MSLNARELSPVDAIQNWLISQVSEQAGVEPSDIDVQLPIDYYGINSAQATSIIDEGESFLGLEISPIILWHYPTIATLSKRLAEELEDMEVETFEI